MLDVDSLWSHADSGARPANAMPFLSVSPSLTLPMLRHTSCRARRFRTFSFGCPRERLFVASNSSGVPLRSSEA
eukprot:1803986-Pyramimonas_sp.AAC.1